MLISQAEYYLCSPAQVYVASRYKLFRELCTHPYSLATGAVHAAAIILDFRYFTPELSHLGFARCQDAVQQQFGYLTLNAFDYSACGTHAA